MRQRRSALSLIFSVLGIAYSFLLFGCVRAPRQKDSPIAENKCYAKAVKRVCDGDATSEFCFHLTNDSTVNQIVVSLKSGSMAHCTLQVASEIYANPVDRIYQLEDLNDDGCSDLCVYSTLGANSRAQYWMGMPGCKFKYIGFFPELQKDSASKRLKSYVRGGYAGGEYESKEYFFEGDSLVTCRTLSQKYDTSVGDTSFFLLTETARPPCDSIERQARVKVYQVGDSTVIDTVR